MNVDGVRVAITGGAGFLGGLLARRLLDTTAISVGGAEPRPISAIQLLDLVEPPHDLSAEARIGALTGPLEQTIPQLGDVDLLCHLAGVVSGAAERDFDLGMRTNLDALRQLLDHARSFAAPPVVVFTSSLAVFGSDPAVGPVGHGRRRHPAQTSIQLRDSEVHRRAAPRRLHPTRVYPRPQPSTHDCRRPTRQTQRGGLQLHLGNHP